MIHVLKVRTNRDGSVSQDDLVAWLDGVEVKGLQRIELHPMVAGSTEPIRATLTMLVSPDIEVPAETDQEGG